MSSDATYLVPIEERVCTRCTRIRTLNEFPAGSGVCTACSELLAAEDANARYEKMRELVCAKTVRHMIAERKGTKIDAPHISEYVATLVKELGGLQHLAEMHATQVRHAIDDDPGSKKVLDHFKVLANLITASTEHRQSAPDVEGLTDDEIIAEFQLLTMQGLTADKDTFRDVLQMMSEVDCAAG